MAVNKQFQELVASGQSVGQVVAVDRFVVTLAGLDDAPLGSVILFDDGNTGFVRAVEKEVVKVLTLTSENISPGQLAVFLYEQLHIEVGNSVLGRVLNPLGEPIDGKGPLKATEKRMIFQDAPALIDRASLNEQLPVGVPVVDTLFSIIKGQRIAVMGDQKTGKTTLLSKIALNQKDSDTIFIFALVGKQKRDLESLYHIFTEAGILKRVVIVSANILDPLPLLYIAPYAACTIAEYFWFQGKDCVIVYDDLSNHAKAYREMSLLLKITPGRDSYPGDIFYLHSSLLERAGKLKKTGKSLTAIPAILTPHNDITGYISSNIISITDGQIFFDTTVYDQGILPAINIGLSVSRVGERAKTKFQKQLAAQIIKQLAAYREAQQFIRFGTRLSEKIQQDRMIGEQIYEFFQLAPEEVIGLTAQHIILQAILMNNGIDRLNIPLMKEQVRNFSVRVTDAPEDRDQDIIRFAGQLLAATTGKNLSTAKP